MQFRSISRGPTVGQQAKTDPICYPVGIPKIYRLDYQVFLSLKIYATNIQVPIPDFTTKSIYAYYSMPASILWKQLDSKTA